jgi:tRNA pseudouridine13 synthase
MTKQFSLDWAYALGQPLGNADFRSQPEDFQVTENLGFELSGTGEHVYLHIEKRGDNTIWLAKQIARLVEVNPSDVGYCGLKDRHAVTQQWFSVYLPKGAEPDWRQLNSETVTLLGSTRHVKKLRRGMHAFNHFIIRLRNYSGDDAHLADRLEQIKQQGVPNYFGEQRFGHGGNNLIEANGLLVDGVKVKNRQMRGLYLSAARSFLFNQVLSYRIANNSWQTLIAGDVADVVNAAIPTGPLWGRGRLSTQTDCLALEEQVLAPWQDWSHGLEHVGLAQERRALLLPISEFKYTLEESYIELSFALPPGCFATAVLRELCCLNDVSRVQAVV